MYETLKKVVNEKMAVCDNYEDMERYQIIAKILEDNNCFKIMKTETAYKLLSDLGYSMEEVKKIYNDIIFELSN